MKPSPWWNLTKLTSRWIFVELTPVCFKRRRTFKNRWEDFGALGWKREKQRDEKKKKIWCRHDVFGRSSDSDSTSDRSVCYFQHLNKTLNRDASVFLINIDGLGFCSDVMWCCLNWEIEEQFCRTRLVFGFYFRDSNVQPFPANVRERNHSGSR